ncbi:MAG: HAMP domain-containing protein, partial [Gammaproteobacteria bacterium]|nr:HAMP domain-containing protein [Gammaproteobacteria bacterium]
MKNLSIGKKLGLGFLAMALIIAGAVGTNTVQVVKTQDISTRMTHTRVPTAEASLDMLNGINGALANLRGWMLLGKDKFRARRARNWSEGIWPALDVMKEKSKSWTNPENIERLRVMGEILPELEKIQIEIEKIAQTRANVPSVETLFEQAAPVANTMIENITRLIDIETGLAATRERKDMLSMMADVRGTTGLGLANIRAFLLSGDDRFKQTFNKFWAKNEKRFGDLSDNAYLLNDEQRKAFDAFSEARAKFAPLPGQMFESRSGDDWNLANYWLATRAAPRGARLVAIIDEMQINQKQLLATDADALEAEIDFSLVLGSLLLALGLALACIIGFFTTRSLTGAINSGLDVAQKISRGDFSSVIEIKSNDETGQLLQSLQVMQDNLKERIEADAAAAKVNGRIKTALDAVNTNVMLADADMNIIYMNNAVTKMMKDAETKLRESLPGFDTDKLIGANIDSFHKNPSHQR